MHENVAALLKLGRIPTDEISLNCLSNMIRCCKRRTR